MKTKIVVFSSVEGLKLAKAIQRDLYTDKFSCKLWTNNFFKLSSTTLDSLRTIGNSYQLAVIVLSPDDCIVSREDKFMVPRDNVIFELGLCVGMLGMDRTIIVQPNDLKLPSDLGGVTPCKFYPDDDIDATAGYITSYLEDHITKLKESNLIVDRIYWDEYCELIDALLGKLKKSVNFGGYYFDVIVSISRGGILVADLLSRTYGYSMPVLSMVANRRDGHGTYDSDEVLDYNSFATEMLVKNGYKNILVVDSAVRSGITIERAVEFIKKRYPDAVIKTGTLIVNASLKDKVNVDFVVQYRDTDNMDFYYNVYH